MDYERFIANLFLASIIIIAALIVALVMVITKLLKRKTNEETFKLQALKDVSHDQLEESERTLAEVSRKIHNTVWQNACLMSMLLEQVKEAPDENDHKDILSRAIATNSQMIHDIERICHTLNYDFFGVTGLENTIEKELEYYAHHEDILYSVKREGGEDKLIPEIRLIVFRIVQEAIANIIRHAQASDIDVLIKPAQNDFIISISDNGVGFSPDRLHSIQGAGLKIMRARSKIIGAALDIRSVPGSGTTVSLTVPHKT